MSRGILPRLPGLIDATRDCVVALGSSQRQNGYGHVIASEPSNLGTNSETPFIFENGYYPIGDLFATGISGIGALLSKHGSKGDPDAPVSAFCGQPFPLIQGVSPYFTETTGHGALRIR